MTDCINLSFFLTLHPLQNNSDAVACPNLEELILCVQAREKKFYTQDLLEMAKERASVGAKLSAIVITS